MFAGTYSKFAPNPVWYVYLSGIAKSVTGIADQPVCNLVCKKSNLEAQIVNENYVYLRQLSTHCFTICSPLIQSNTAHAKPDQVTAVERFRSLTDYPPDVPPDVPC